MQWAAADMDAIVHAVRGGSTHTDDETHSMESIRAGDQSAFVVSIDRYHTGLLRLARVFVRDAWVVEEVPASQSQSPCRVYE